MSRRKSTPQTLLQTSSILQIVELIKSRLCPRSQSLAWRVELTTKGFRQWWAPAKTWLTSRTHTSCIVQSWSNSERRNSELSSSHSLALEASYWLRLTRKASSASTSSGVWKCFKGTTSPRSRNHNVLTTFLLTMSRRLELSWNTKSKTKSALSLRKNLYRRPW